MSKMKDLTAIKHDVRNAVFARDSWEDTPCCQAFTVASQAG